MGHGYPVKLGRVNRVPKYGVAEIAPEKLTKYILDPENETGKWRLFKAIGYDLDNPQDLERDERMGLSYESTPRRRAALNALQRGLNRSYQQHRDFWDGNF